MDFELDSDAFYICTEVSPRNYVVQKAIQIDKSQIERMVGKFDGKTAVERPTSTDPGTSAAHSPGTSASTSASGVIAKPPPLPYWFNRECKATLMMIGPQPLGSVPIPSPSSQHPSQYIPPVEETPSTRDEKKQQLKAQLEFYFSRENLMQDRYLRCQMDHDQYVLINVIANFRKIKSVTTDIELIMEALKESAILELNETGDKVRALTKRTTIIIREIPEEHKEEVEKLLADGPAYVEMKYGSNDSWYITYENELDTQVAYVSVQHKKNEVTQRPVCARIRAGGIPPVAPTEVKTTENGRTTTLSNGETGTIQLREIGQTLADFGHFEYSTPTCRFSGNSVYQQPPPLLSQLPQQPSQLYYYSSSASTTPRNFDEMSTASSNSTRTTTSNYARSASRNGGNGNQYNESRSFSGSANSNEWRARVGSGGADRRFQGNGHNNHHESNGRQQNGRGSWRGGQRNGGGRHNHQNGHGNWRNENGHSQAWRSNENHNQYSHHRHAPQVSSSSSSSASSKYFSPEGANTPTNSGASTPPPVQPNTYTYSVPTPTDLPAPPVWPAPNYDRRRKSSEASSITITATATNTLTPSTPVTPPVHRPTFVESVEVKKDQKEVTEAKKEQNGHDTNQSRPKLEQKPHHNHVAEKVQSPPAHVVSPVVPSFAFEETAFPCLPKKAEPEKKPQKPTFSSVAAGRRNIKQMVPEKKLSYAEKLKQRQSLLRH